MLFNSYVFLLAFLPVTLLVFYAAARSVGPDGAKIWLSLASLFFYGWWDYRLVVLLSASVILNYVIGAAILQSAAAPTRQKAILILGIAGNLAVLCFYKYLFPLLDFLHQENILSGTYGSIILPIGISFFTFTQIGYLVDCQQGLARQQGFFNYVLFVTFFPHLIAGPILHHREIMPQFADPAVYRFRFENLAVGLTLFTVGLAKKVLIADSIAPFAENAFTHTDKIDFIFAWLAALSYSMQLYFDFSGYSDMALGLGRMFGVRLPQNFNSPYKATSIIEFWQRFHMTLTRYLTLLLYNPLALWIARRRRAQGLPIDRRATATLVGFVSMVAFPTIATMFLAGVWHGAGFNFMIFGLLHGLYITANHFWRIFLAPDKAIQGSALRTMLGTFTAIAITYLAVLVSQVVFRAETVGDAISILSGMIGLHGTGLPLPVAAHHIQNIIGQRLSEFGIIASATTYEYFHTTRPIVLNAAWLLLAGAIAWGTPNIYQLLGQWSPALQKPLPLRIKILAWRPSIIWATISGALFFTAYCNLQQTARFLYFQF